MKNFSSLNGSSSYNMNISKKKKEKFDLKTLTLYKKVL